MRYSCHALLFTLVRFMSLLKHSDKILGERRVFMVIWDESKKIHVLGSHFILSETKHGMDINSQSNRMPFGSMHVCKLFIVQKKSNKIYLILRPLRPMFSSWHLSAVVMMWNLRNLYNWGLIRQQPLGRWEEESVRGRQNVSLRILYFEYTGANLPSRS